MRGVDLRPQLTTSASSSRIRDGQGDADYTSHVWVRDEMVYAKGKQIPVVPVHEIGVKVPDAMLGNLQHVRLDPSDRLACVAEVMTALGNRNMRRLRLEPASEELKNNLWVWRHDSNFKVEYRTRDEHGYDSVFREGWLDLVDLAFFLNVLDVPSKAQIDLQGVLGGQVRFSSGFVSTNAMVPVKILAHP